MTEDGISRRNMIVLAGAGAALAACSSTGEGGRDDAGVLGRPGPWGLDPNVRNWPAGLPQGLPEFRPNYITVLIISSPAPWKLTANYASFETTGMDEAAREARALAILRFIAPNAQARKPLRDTASQPWQVYKRKGPRHKDQIDVASFDGLGSNQAAELFIWLDIPNAALGGDYWLSFTPQTAAGAPAARNDSFFARALATAVHGRPVLAVRNSFTSYDEQTRTFTPRVSGSAAAIYAMNLHFQLPDGSAGGGGLEPFPIVIDPDTGNGIGFEP